LDEGRPLLRAGARIGTSAARRVALLEHFFVTAVPTALRGNVPTRVGRAIEGRVDGVVLAAAGLARLRLDPRPLIAVALRPERWTPAPAQGALGLQCRAGDRATEAALARLTDPVAQRCVAAERSLLAKMEGGCHAAFGACARVLPSGELHLAAGLRGEVSSWLAVDSAGPDEAAVDTLFAVLSAGADAADRSACWTAAEAWW
jgi:hydroxymethylbilane synthase